MIPNEKSSCKTKFCNVKYQNTDLLVGTQTAHSPCVIMWMEGTCCLLSTWSRTSLHWHAVLKNVLDPSLAPCQNSNYYWCYNYNRKVLAGTSYKHQSPLLFHHSATPNLRTKAYCRQIWDAASRIKWSFLLR
jgi:hypothetical protein